MDSLFRTIVETNKGVRSIKPHDGIFFLGSCFADNISQILKDGMMCCEANPFGTVYNPMSVSHQLERIIDDRACKNEELFYNGKLWVSWLTHTKIYDASKDMLQDKIDALTHKMHDFLKKVDTVAITFGTSWTYKLLSTQAIVANCHKMPADMFVRERLTKDEIVGEWDRVLAKLKNLNPGVHVVFTVSPIRHVKDTMHGNQVSKAILLEAVDELVGKHIDTSYFEAYELVMDDLRDYRFYADDMIHPSSVAVAYIYEHFADAYLSNEAQQMVKEGRRITQALGHRPMGSSEDYLNFVEATTKRVECFRQKYNLESDAYNIAQAVKILNDIKLQLK